MQQTWIIFGAYLSIIGLYMAIYPSFPIKYKSFFDKPLLKSGSSGFGSLFPDLSVAECLNWCLIIGILVGHFVGWYNWKMFLMQPYNDPGVVWFSISGASGHWCDILLGLTLIPVSSNSFIVRHLHLSSDVALKFHKIAAYSVSIATIVHGVIFWGIYISTELPNNTVAYQVFNIGNPGPLDWTMGSYTALLGVLAAGILFIMTFLALPIFRRRLYSYFVATHPYFAIILVIFASLHASTDFYYCLPGLVLYALELVDRFILFAFMKPSSATVSVEECGYLRVDVVLPYGDYWGPAMWAHLRFPELSSVGHPFTAAMVKNRTATFLIKPQRGLTKQLFEITDTNKQIPMRISVPRGPLNFHLDDLSGCVCFVAGSGITGGLSIVASWLDVLESKRGGKVVLVWVYPEREGGSGKGKWGGVSILDDRVTINHETLPVPIDEKESFVETVTTTASGQSFNAHELMSSIVLPAAASASNKGPLGVYICGPTAFTYDVEMATRQVRGNSGVDVVMYKETYQW
ncbi:hypothetical protein HDU76_000818 [Blyttiomyces sp. JEL0837]|nr:hypothetical protein HDU76_000818 [Blyttiomyces sp. JEL0837]